MFACLWKSTTWNRKSLSLKSPNEPPAQFRENLIWHRHVSNKPTKLTFLLCMNCTVYGRENDETHSSKWESGYRFFCGVRSHWEKKAKITEMCSLITHIELLQNTHFSTSSRRGHRILSCLITIPYTQLQPNVGITVDYVVLKRISGFNPMPLSSNLLKRFVLLKKLILLGDDQTKSHCLPFISVLRRKVACWQRGNMADDFRCYVLWDLP